MEVVSRVSGNSLWPTWIFVECWRQSFAVFTVSHGRCDLWGVVPEHCWHLFAHQSTDKIYGYIIVNAN